MKEQRLRLALATVKDRYDFIIIDCPPSLSMLTINALVAANAALIPVQCEYYALEGLSALIKTVERIRQRLNPQLHIGGLLRTMFDPRNNLANQVSAQLLTHFPKQVYNTIIPRNVRLAEAPSHGLPATLYDKTSRGALAYGALAAEIVRKEAAVHA
jgi:chromosome partitioning protein